MKEYYSTQEFAEALGISLRTVMRMIKMKRIYTFRAGPSKQSKHRIPHNEISRMIEADLKNSIK